MARDTRNTTWTLAERSGSGFGTARPTRCRGAGLASGRLGTLRKHSTLKYTAQRHATAHSLGVFLWVSEIVPLVYSLGDNELRREYVIGRALGQVYIERFAQILHEVVEAVGRQHLIQTLNKYEIRIR